MVEILLATSDRDYQVIAGLAEEIWTEHFTPIIGPGQVRYMLDTFQSATAIAHMCESGFVYYLAWVDSVPVGYCAARREEDGKIFLSKLYVLQRARGMGIAQTLLEKLQAHFPASAAIWLTVNRNNKTSIDFYLKRGFSITNEVKTPIGKGFYMDDYIMQMDFGG